MDKAISSSTLFLPDNFLLIEAEKKLMRNAIWFLKKWSGFAVGDALNDNKKCSNDNNGIEEKVGA